MRAKIVTQAVYDGVLGYTHGFGYPIKRLVVEDASNLALTAHDGHLYVIPDFDIDGCTVIGEVELPPGIVARALRIHQTQKVLAEKIEELIGASDV